MDAAAERCEHADAPVAEFVAAALDDDSAVVGHRAGRGFLVGEKLHQVFRGSGIEIVFADEAVQRGRFRQPAEFTDQRTDPAAEFERTAWAVALPERHFAGLAGGGRHENAVVGDLDDTPGGCAEDEGLAGMAFEDHLFVEFAYAHGLSFAVGEKDAVKAAVGNGACVENGKAGRAVACGNDIAQAVPGEAGTQFGEFVGWVTAAEQIENAFECCARESAEGSGTADEIEEKVHVDFGFRGFGISL